MAGNLGDLIVRVMAQVEPFLTDMEKVSASVDKTVKDAESKFKGFDALAGKLSDIGGAMTLGLTAPIMALGGLGIKAAAEFESMEKGLTAVEGSSEAAGKELEDLREIAKLPGLGLPEAVEGYTRLRAVGVEADKAERYLSAFGNALATVGKGRADLEAVVGQLVQMSTKTKVVSEDLKPIMERVPQVAQITKAIYGTIDTEALQKAGITTKDYLAAVLPELEKLPKITGGLGNSIENLQDTAKQALTKIGEAFAPVAAAALPVLEKVLTGIADLATKFTEMPAPVQAGIGALVALAAAIGPVLLAVGQITSVITTAMPALAGMAEFFGVTVAALGGWALAIAAVAAALVAFGVWVYQNWDGVSAVLKQAWDGIAEMWANAWGPLLPYIKAIWDAVSKVTVAAWKGISDALSTVWNAIKSVAAKVWGGIVDVFQTFLKWAAKIPGANKLINLDEAWNSAKQATAALEKTAAATKEMGNAAGAAAPKVDILTGAVKKKSAAQIEAEKAAVRMQKANEDMFARYDKQAADMIASVTKLNEVTKQLEKSNADLALTFGAAHEKMRTEALKTVEIIVPTSQRIPAVVQDWIKENKKLEEAYKNLGVTSTAELEKMAADAAKNYELIKEKGVDSPRVINAAWVAMEEARIKAAKAAGEIIPKEQLKALEKMKEQLEGKLPEQTGIWSEWSKQISTIVTDAGKKISELLVGMFKDGGENKKLAKEQGELRASLETRAEEWAVYEATIRGKMEETTRQHAEELARQEKDLNEDLAERLRTYEEFVSDTATKVEELRAGHAEELAEEVAELHSALAEKTDAYNEYATEVAERIDELRATQAEKLAEELENLRGALAEKQEAYEDYVTDVETKLSRLGEATEDDITDTKRGLDRKLADKRKALDRDTQETNRKIATELAKGEKANLAQVADWRQTLSEKQEDTAEYIRREVEDYDDYVEEHRKRAQQQSDDYKIELDRRTRDHQQFIDDNKAKQSQAVVDSKTTVDKQTADLLEGLAKRGTELEKFRVDTEAKLDSVTAKHAADLAQEEAELAESVTRKTAEWERYRESAVEKLDGIREKSRIDLEADTTQLNQDLETAKTAFETFRTDTEGKLTAIEAQFTGAWDRVKTGFTGILTEMGGAIVRFGSEYLEQKLFKWLLTDLLDDILPKVSKAFAKVFGTGAAGAAGDVAGAAGDVAGGAGDVAGGAGSALGAAVGGLTGIVTAVASVVTAISSVIGNFQMAKMETSLNAIEHNTRYTMMYVGERADGGILGQLFKITENTRWILGGIDDLRAHINHTIEQTLTDSKGELEKIRLKLEELATPLTWGSSAARAIETTVNGIAGTLGELRNTAGDIRAAMQSGGGNWTVTFTGDPIAAQVGQQIMSQLRAQGAKIV